MRHITGAIIVVLLFAVAGFAQTATVIKNAPIYVKPDPPATLLPLRMAAVGTVLRVVGQEGEWIQVQFQDPQWGERTGWVSSELVRVNRPELQPMDLSVRPQQPPSSQPPQMAATPATRRFERGWIDVNFGLAISGADMAAFAYTGVLYDEPFALAAAYPKPSLGAEFDFGGGFMFTPVVGLGVSFTGTAHDDIVGLGATIPDPFFYDNATTASGSTSDELQRTEGGVHIQAMVVPLHRRNLRVRVFGGPTYFRYYADMVQDIQYTQSASPYRRANSVEITGYEAVRTEGTGWGVHVGGDVSYFLSRIVGVGGFGRFSYGKVTVPEPMSEARQDIVVGGFQVGGGLRLRF
jgi:hypothetical protein